MQKSVKITFQDSIDRATISSMLNEAFCGFALIQHHYTQKEQPAFTTVMIAYDCNGITISDIEAVFERRNIVIEKTEDMGVFEKEFPKVSWEGVKEKSYMQFQ